MVGLFKRKQESFLGINLGVPDLKVVQLDKSNGSPVLRAYGFCQECLSLDNLEQAAKILKNVLEEAKVTTKNAIMSVPVFASFSRLIELPQMPEQEISKAVNFEAKKYIPVPSEEINLGWEILSKKPEKLQILLVAIPKKLSKNYAQIADLAGLKLVALETETFALVRSLVGKEMSPVIIIELEQEGTNISIIEQAKIKISRSLEKDTIEEINWQLKKIIAMQAEKDIIPIKKIILTGQQARKPGLVEKLSVLGTPVEIGNPFKEIKYPAKLKTILNELRPSLAVAVGLAMREM